jgi:predicted Rossmann fold flavoprotein
MSFGSGADAGYDVLILGAGAAGLYCALEAGRRGLRVALLDHASQPGRKILISGGGRANFTHLHTRPENFLSENPHFAKSALARYPPEEFVALVEKHGIAYHHKTPGQLFCDGSATQIVAMLVAECERAGVSLELGVEVSEVRRDENFRVVAAAHRRAWTAPVLVIATGGLSIPKLGATDFGYRLARQFGLRVVPPRPALVPLLFSADDLKRFRDLSGVSAEVEVFSSQRDAPRFVDKMLITHRGLSGPAILQISSYWQPGASLMLDLAPGADVYTGLGTRRDAAAAVAALEAVLPRRLADRLAHVAPPTAWTNAALADAEHTLHHWTLTPAGTEGYEKAEVTAGGVDTRELSAQTMEARKVPGLYFIGEVVDVTGHLGGYNFQWAWASAAAAARSL